MPPYLLAALSLAEMLTSSLSLSKHGSTQPSVLSDAIGKLTALLESGINLVAPSSVENILTDMLDAIAAAKDVLPADVSARLDSIQGLLSKSQASISNLSSGQVAQVCTVTMSFNGVSVPVDVFAIRQDSKTEVATDLGLSA
jgi:hypothetical protein